MMTIIIISVSMAGHDVVCLSVLHGDKCWRQGSSVQTLFLVS